MVNGCQVLRKDTLLGEKAYLAALLYYRPPALHCHHCWAAPEGLSPGQCPNPVGCHVRGPSCWSAGSHRCRAERVLRADVSGCSRGMTFPVTARSKSGTDCRFPNVAPHILRQELQRDGTPISSSSSWSVGGWISCSDR